MHRSRIFQLCLLGFIGGVFVVSFFILPNVTIWIVLALGAICALSDNSIPRTVGIILLASVLGIWRANSALQVHSQLRSSNEEATIVGYVASDVVPTKSGIQYAF